MGNWLVAGVNSDADILRCKGPTILSSEERCEIVRHCKFIDEVAPDTAYTPSAEFLKSIGCHFFAHGDDPTFDSDGVDITIRLRELGMFKVFKRTEGVSTTDITGKLLAIAAYQNSENKDREEPILNKIQNPPMQ